MGIDLHNLALLAYALDLGARFDRTLGIGRQALYVDPPELARFRSRRGWPALAEPARAPASPHWFEPLLAQWFGAKRVDSVDASPYEQASIVHDMNLPWPADAPGRGSYDAVLDFGCLEHVFAFPTAWRNCTLLCRVGGHVLHALPANNLSGHGFYQFSPELFFNLYRPENGFELRGLWMAMKAEPRYWWRVADPRLKKGRVTLRNGHETYLLVIARKLRELGPLPPPQQSDYAEQEWQRWATDGAAGVSGAKSGALSQPRGAASALRAVGLIDVARRWRERLSALRGAALDLPGADYERVDVAALLGRGGAP